MATPKNKFWNHRRNATKRGVQFLLTFDEWIKIWTDSGHWHERGPRKGQYVMARFGDKGPYKVGNVKIVTTEQNNSEGNLGKVYGPAIRKKISKGTTGRVWSETHHRNLSKSRIGNQNRLGIKHSIKTKIKMRTAQKLRRQREKLEEHER